jgi:hypothetical protein
MLFPLINVSHFYISTLSIMCAVPSMAVWCSSFDVVFWSLFCSGIFWVMLRRTQFDDVSSGITRFTLDVQFASTVTSSHIIIIIIIIYCFVDMTFCTNIKKGQYGHSFCSFAWVFLPDRIMTIKCQDTVTLHVQFVGFKHTSTITDHWGSLNNPSCNEIRQSWSIQSYFNKFIPVKIFMSLPRIF